MKKFFLLTLLIFFTGLSVLAAGCAARGGAGGAGGAEGAEEEAITRGTASPGTKDYKEGEVIVRFRTDITRAEVEQINKSLNTYVKKVLSPGTYLISVPPGLTVEETVDEYMATGEVEYAEPNYIRTIQ